jgi:hypothetical protein
MFLAWSKQLENEGMGTRIGVSVIRRFIHTYDNTCVTTSVVDVTIYFPLSAMYDVLLQTCLGAF